MLVRENILGCDITQDLAKTKQKGTPPPRQDYELSGDDLRRAKSAGANDAFSYDENYLSLIPYFTGFGYEFLENRNDCAWLKDEKKATTHVKAAFDSLDAYLRRPTTLRDDIHSSLQEWLDAVRPNARSLTDEKNLFLTQQIYFMLFMAQFPGWALNTKKSEAKFQSGPVTFPSHIELCRDLNNKLYPDNPLNWGKIAKNLALVFFGAVLIAAGSLAIASGYDSVISPFISAAASFNSEALTLAVAYLGRQIYTRYTRYKQLNELARYVGANTSSPGCFAAQHTADYARITLASTGLFSIGNVLGGLSMNSTALSVAPGIGVAGGKLTGVGASFLSATGAISIVSSMFLVILAGADAVYTGISEIYREVKREKEPSPTRLAGIAFFDNIQKTDPQKEQKGNPGSPAPSHRPGCALL